VARGEADRSLTRNPSRFAPKHKWHATTLRSEPAIPAAAGRTIQAYGSGLRLEESGQRRSFFRLSNGQAPASHGKPIEREAVHEAGHVVQDAVVGDVAELKMRDTRAVCELLGLVLRRQALLWKTWKPWLGLVGIVGPVGVFLSHICVGVLGGLLMQVLVYWQFVSR